MAVNLSVSVGTPITSDDEVLLRGLSWLLLSITNFNFGPGEEGGEPGEAGKPDTEDPGDPASVAFGSVGNADGPVN